MVFGRKIWYVIAALSCVAVLGMLLVAREMGFIRMAGSNSSSQRWYSPVQVSMGEKVFIQNCLSCHGEQGRGAVNWRQRQPDGFFPPPPLDGSAHTWHHPLSALQRTIKNGGAPVGGSMPAFKDVLSEEEIESVIAYIQSHWTEEIYQIWQEKVNKRN